VLHALKGLAGQMECMSNYQAIAEVIGKPRGEVRAKILQRNPNTFEVSATFANPVA
jgi:hypothetical protein